MDSSRIRAIDGLRGWAAISVVFYHAILNYDPSLVANVIAPPVTLLQTETALLSKIALTIFNGEYAVILFFIISGLVLQTSLNRFYALDRGAAFTFFVRRAFQLMPSIFVSVTVAYFVLVACHALTGARSELLPPDMREYVKNLFLIDTKIEGVTWTIRLEIIGVSIIFGIALVGRAFGVAGNLLAFMYALYALQNPALTASIHMLHSALLPFTVGMLAAQPQVGAALERGGAITAPLCLAIFVFARFLVDSAQLTALIAQVIAGGMLVGSLAWSHDNVLTRILQQPPWQFTGRVSYSFYLYAGIIGGALTFTLSRFWSPQTADALPVGLVVGLAICLLTVPVAALAEQYIERPGIALGNWILLHWHGLPAVNIAPLSDSPAPRY
jgi:peptidoglycan/LPS O-acetylase OafA/YrhL